MEDYQVFSDDLKKQIVYLTPALLRNRTRSYQNIIAIPHVVASMHINCLPLF